MVVGVESALEDRIRKVFATVHGPAFEATDELATGLTVDVLDAGVAFDTPTYILVTPWTINGLAFPPDEDFPAAIEIDDQIHVVYSVTRSELGPYRAVNLAPVGSHFPSPAHARRFAEMSARRFRRAVEEARALSAAI